MTESAFRGGHDPKAALEATGSDDPSTSPAIAPGWWSWFAGKPGLWIGLGLGLAAGLLVGGMRLTSEPAAAVDDASEATESAAQPVTVLTVQSTSVERSLETTGTVVPYDLLPIAPRTSGLQIQQVLVDDGDVVTAGQVLAVLDDTVLRSQLLEAQASLESARANVRQQQATLAQTQATLAEAETNLQRFQSLRDEGVISQQDYDSRATAAITSQEGVQVAIANVNSAEAQVASQAARIQQLETQVDQTLVLAPADGLVAERMARLGDVSSTGTPLFSLIQNGQLELEVTLPETQLSQVQVGMPVRVTSDADARIDLQGRLRDIAPLVDPQTREATLTIELPSSSLLRSGMFLRAALILDSRSGVTIPTAAVLPRPDGSSAVYVVQADETVTAQAITVGDVLPGESPKVEVLQGLNPGDRIVVAGASYLNEGDRVAIMPNE
ncbi:MAG: efflux RND transporter periplasmic adaptor subunit [Synechococcales cyanobacterium K44_A2020_017]|nr:efflux RND transporter periplasmic adaptor subunit [Synechococcales cyanobacterium K32_A2020_035]MBF2093431.1 efflux RND transporter periplasmic adaptor subunit [Synechococcales cyanobacterium K44_A2020_017]